ncbi:hypothetical protein D3C76_926130 [compost metagenome]
MIALQQQFSQLSRSCRLTCTLQTCHHDDSRGTIALGKLRLTATHQFGQLFVNDIDDDHTRCKAIHHFTANSFFFHLGNKFFDYFKVDIRFQQGKTYFAHRFVDIIFRNLAFTAQLAEHTLQPVCQSFKSHSPVTSVQISYSAISVRPPAAIALLSLYVPPIIRSAQAVHQV